MKFAEKHMRKILGLVCVLSLLLSLAACGAKPSEELVGTWRTSGGGSSIIFYEDGAFKLSNLGGSTVRGSWDISGSELTLDVDGEEITYDYSVRGDALTLTSDNDIAVFYR